MVQQGGEGRGPGPVATPKPWSLHLCVRVAAWLVFSTGVALWAGPWSLSGGAILGAAALVWRWPGRAAVLRALCSVNLFLLFLWLIVPFSGSEDVLYSMGMLAVHADGVRIALLATVRANIIVCLFLGMVFGTPLHEVIKAMESFFIPHKLCAMLFFCARYVHDIRTMHQRLQTAATLRCFTPRVSRHTWRTAGNMFAMTVVRSLDQAHRVHQAMQLRGYAGSFHRLPQVPLQRLDWLVSGLLGVGFLLLMALEFNLLERIHG